MDILSFGMKMERDGKAFYEEHASKVNDRHAADILRYLAAEEEKHFNYIKNFKEGSKWQRMDGVGLPRSGQLHMSIDGLYRRPTP